MKKRMMKLPWDKKGWKNKENTKYKENYEKEEEIDEKGERWKWSKLNDQRRKELEKSNGPRRNMQGG